MGCSPVVFSYSAWIARYPEFSAIEQATAQEYFNEATIYWNNDGTGPVTNPVVQSMLLNMLTGHIAALYSQSQNDPEPGTAKDANTPVGRMSNATQGSITAAFALTPTNAQEYYAQTKYGMSFWGATAQYRRARYIRGQLQPGGIGPYGPGYGGYGRGGGFY